MFRSVISKSVTFGGSVAVVMMLLFHLVTCIECENPHARTQSYRAETASVASAIAVAHAKSAVIADDAGKASAVALVIAIPTPTLVAITQTAPIYDNAQSRNSSLAHRAVTVLLI